MTFAILQPNVFIFQANFSGPPSAVILPKFSLISPFGFSVTTDPPFCCPKNQVIPPHPKKTNRKPPPPPIIYDLTSAIDDHLFHVSSTSAFFLSALYIRLLSMKIVVSPLACMCNASHTRNLEKKTKYNTLAVY